MPGLEEKGERDNRLGKLFHSQCLNCEEEERERTDFVNCNIVSAWREKRERDRTDLVNYIIVSAWSDKERREGTN